MNPFETLRELVPVEEVVGHYSEVKGNKTRCVAPNHPDVKPAMHLYTDHVHCFVCGFHGDVTDVWAAIKGFDCSIEAARGLAREYGIELPERDPEAQKKAPQRRRKEEEYLELARERHAALAKHDRVRDWWEGRGFDATLQERFLLGVSPHENPEAIIPFWYRGRVCG